MDYGRGVQNKRRAEIYNLRLVNMAVIVNLDVVLAQRKIRSKELAEAIGITEQNLSILKTGKAKAIRFSTLDAICAYLKCQPGDLLAYSEQD